jgi:hypothetical protein
MNTKESVQGSNGTDVSVAEQTTTVLFVELVADKKINFLAMPVIESCDPRVQIKHNGASPDEFAATLMNLTSPALKDIVRPIVQTIRERIWFKDSVKAELLYCKKDCTSCPVMHKSQNPNIITNNRYCGCQV